MGEKAFARLRRVGMSKYLLQPCLLDIYDGYAIYCVIMNSITIQAIEARQKFGELLERVYYQNRVYRITRKEKPMGWLVGDEFMETVGKLMDHIIENEPVLADTLALTLDDEIRSVVEHGMKERKEGKLIP